MSLPDYSEFLKKPGMLAYIEQEWQKSDMHKNQAASISEYTKDKSVIEVGCSTGNLARFLDCESYLGFDANEDALAMAEKKNPSKAFKFKFGNVRDLRRTKNQNADVVIAMAFMKHFGLHEWDEILNQLVKLSNGIVIIDCPIYKQTHDDGLKHGHHHVWMEIGDLFSRFQKLGLDCIEKINTNPVEPIFILKKI